MSNPSFDEFIKNGWQNRWVTEPGIDMYVRISNPIRGTNYDLANLDAHLPGNGSFTAFLDKYEPKYTFFIENVVNVLLDDYLIRRGYKLMKTRLPDHCYVMG